MGAVSAHDLCVCVCVCVCVFLCMGVCVCVCACACTQGGFVAGFSSSNLGDVSPNTRGPHCVNTGLPCDYLNSSCPVGGVNTHTHTHTHKHSHTHTQTHSV